MDIGIGGKRKRTVLPQNRLKIVKSPITIALLLLEKKSLIMLLLSKTIDPTGGPFLLH